MDGGGVETRQGLLVRTFVELADTLVSDFDVVDFMTMLTERSVELLGLAAAGVLLTDQRGRLQVVASSDSEVRLLELLELQHEEGPCIDAFRLGAVVQTDHAETARRWPLVAAAAAAQGYLAVCALPLRLRQSTIGALNLFRADDVVLDGSDLATAQALADVATVGLLQERAMRESRVLAEQLQTALNSRVVLEQAKGVLAEQTGLSVDTAFEALRAYARLRNLKLADVARQVVTGELSGDNLAR